MSAEKDDCNEEQQQNPSPKRDAIGGLQGKNDPLLKTPQ
jgi:hypothetical protein